MPASPKQPNKKRNEKKSAKNIAQLDLLFAGPLLLVPSINDGLVQSVEIFAPNNGHPIGAVFLPGVWFSDAELNDPECARWPAASTFTLLDPHSYAIEISQRAAKKSTGFRSAKIPQTNHKVRPGRRVSSDWEIAIAVQGKLAGWSSHRLMQIREGFFHGADAPTSGTAASSLHKLTYEGVTAADFCGASGEARGYLKENAAKGGSLIVIGEIPYQSSLLHERRAIDALAKLAGLDLHLVDTAPAAYRTRLMSHTGPCGFSTILSE